MRPRRAGAALGALALAGVLSACGLVYDADALDHGAPRDDEAGDAGSPVPDAAEAGTNDAPGRACPSSRGPRMIDADGQCIDATEVTVADYDLFRRQEGSLMPLPEPCRWVASLTPDTFDEQLKTPRRPVVDVHYCHAFHYCAWAGKRLCGRASGGAVLPGDAGLDPQQNQWLHACTKAGTQAYSYGKTVVPAACTNADIVDVATRGACDGPYPGLSDMLGNVGEWVDGCVHDATRVERDGCTVLGYERVRNEASCYDVSEVSRYQTSPDLGFRCCGL